MIGRLTGTLIEKFPPQVIVDCQGVGYEVDVPMSTFYNLPPTGERVVLHVHHVVREDADLLYGFGSLDERKIFRQMIKISGVGPKLALSVLSGLSIGDLVQAVTEQDTGRLIKIPGVGKKTAERLLLELRDKLDVDEGIQTEGSGKKYKPSSDVVNALIGLGYSDKEAAHVVKQLPSELTVTESIRQALKMLSKA